MRRTWAENRGVLIAPIIAMAAVGVVGTAMALSILYNAVFDEEMAHLRVIAQSQVKLIEAVARFDAEQSTDFPGGARAATISQVVAAYRQDGGFGRTGSFVIGERSDDQIVFIFSHDDDGAPQRVAWNSGLGEPMRRALSGLSGIMVAADYQEETVLAAYEPVPALDLGIVAKMDLAEIRAPFVRAILYAAAAVLGFVVIAVFASMLITGPLLRELTRSRREAVEASLAKSQFLANMSHELRTPLNAIIGFADTMRHKILGPLRPGPYDGYIDGIHASGLRLLFIISDILEMAKIESGKYTLYKERVDVEDIIVEAVRAVQWRVDEGDLRVVWDVSPGLPAMAADRRAIKMVLINLLHNAAKFTLKRGKITIKAAIAGEAMSISVTDTGVGIRPEDMERAFKPFTQIEREHNHFHEGVGLGLALSKALVEMHGGALSLASEFCKGVTATVVLPLGQAAPLIAASTSVLKDTPGPGLVWYPAMSIGVEKWDEDHRALLNLINNLRTADGVAVFDLIETLAAYVDIHLKSEEKAMQDLGYRRLAEHREKHDEFRRWFADIRQAKDNPTARLLPHEMVDYLSHWLCSHILKTDMRYKEFFADNRREILELLKNYKTITEIRRT